MRTAHSSRLYSTSTDSTGQPKHVGHSQHVHWSTSGQTRVHPHGHLVRRHMTKAEQQRQLRQAAASRKAKGIYAS